MSNKTNYGNWVSKSMLRTFYLVTGVIIVLTGISLSGLLSSWNPLVLRTLQISGTILTLILVAASVYFTCSHRLFSYDGKERIQERIVDYVVAHLNLPESAGTVLDIGCGSGVVSIKTARRYSWARITGIDYWGKGWDYAKQQCEQNAESEGVKDRITFQKGDAGKLAFADESFDGAISNFVFHEVRTQPDKRQVVREALRVIKKGGSFAFHDLFLDRSLYGDIEELVAELKKEGITKIEFIPTADTLKIPQLLRNKVMIGNIGLIYGVK